MEDSETEVGTRIRLVHNYVCCIPLSGGCYQHKGMFREGAWVRAQKHPLSWPHDGIREMNVLNLEINSHSIVKTPECSMQLCCPKFTD